MSEIRPRARDEIRAMDRRAIEEVGIPGMVLMENAGRGAAAIAAELADPADGPVVCACGRGNNGGDGFVIARHLTNRGYDVSTWLAADPAEVDESSDAGRNLAIARRMGIPVHPMRDGPEIERFGEAARRAALLVDGLLGTGITGEVRSPADRIIDLVNASGAPVVAVDTPSGLDVDTGEVLGTAVRAEVTPTFGAPKIGFEKGEGPARVGRVELVDISIPRAFYEELDG